MSNRSTSGCMARQREPSNAPGGRSSISRPVHQELQQRKHLTVQLVWHEYREEHPDGYSYSQYCELYRAWKVPQHAFQRRRLHHVHGRVVLDLDDGIREPVTVDGWRPFRGVLAAVVRLVAGHHVLDVPFGLRRESRAGVRAVDVAEVIDDVVLDGRRIAVVVCAVTHRRAVSRP